MKTIILAILLLTGACASAPPTPTREISNPTPAGQGYMSLLVRFLTGTFETIPQEGVPFVAEKLRHAPFWKGIQGEHWVYAEYVHPGDEAHPYRQRIYRFTESNGVISAAIFELPGDPARFVGEWRKAEPFARYKPSDLVERPGCRLTFLAQYDVLFNGGRAGTACRSDLPGAHHEHAEFYLSSATLRTWEDGRDAANKHIAGPNRPSEFRKMLQFPQ